MLEQRFFTVNFYTWHSCFVFQLCDTATGASGLLTTVCLISPDVQKHILEKSQEQLCAYQSLSMVI